MAQINIPAMKVGQIAYAALQAHADLFDGNQWVDWRRLSLSEKNEWASNVQWTADNIKAGPAATWAATREAEEVEDFNKASLNDQERLFIFRAIVGAFVGWRPTNSGRL